MTETEAPAQHHPAFWLKPALLVPLAIGGLCLAGVALLAEVLLALALYPFQTEVFEVSREIYLILARFGGRFFILAIFLVAAHFVIKRIDGEASSILSDVSLMDAMFKDHCLLVWLLLALMVATLGNGAAGALLDLGTNIGSLGFVFFGGLPALRLVGLAIERRQPELWSEIQSRAAHELAWPGPKMLALLIFVFAFAAIVGSLPAILSIWSALT